MPKLLPDLPPAVYRAIQCERCGAALHRADTGWVCPRGLSHTPLILDLGILERIEPHLPFDGTRPVKEKGKTLSGRSVQLRQVLRLLKTRSRRGQLPNREGV